MLTNESVARFAGLLASDAPVPGGGAAAAVVGALGAAAAAMAGELTRNKPRYAPDSALLTSLCEKLAAYRERLLALADADAEAFGAISAVYRMQKEDPARPAALEAALKKAVVPPMETLRVLSAVTDALRQLGEKASPIMISDVGTGAAAVTGALKGAALNVFINTGALQDAAFARALEQEADDILARCLPVTEALWAAVQGRLRQGRKN